MARLVFLDGQGSEKEYAFTRESTSVGRGEHNDLVIRNPSVSLNHCEILVHSAEVIVRELNSSNGTYVDRRRVRHQRQVKSGQVIHFGSVAARLELDESDEVWAPDPSVESAIHEPLPPPSGPVRTRVAPISPARVPDSSEPGPLTQALQKTPAKTPQVKLGSAPYSPAPVPGPRPHSSSVWKVATIVVAFASAALALVLWLLI